MHRDEYLDYIRRKGVGDRDVVASSPDSYVSYLNGVSEILGIEISPLTVPDEAAVERIVDALRGERADKTISNYRSALRQYAAMVGELSLGD
jgi:hypothetical protein